MKLNLSTFLLLIIPSITLSQPEILWHKFYGGNGTDVCYSLIRTLDGGYAMGGSYQSFRTGYDYLILKTDRDGDLEWSGRFGSDENKHDICRSVLQDNHGNYLIAGYTSSYGPGTEAVWAIKLDSSGQEIWSEVYGGDGWDVCRSVITVADGGYLLGGYTDSFGAGSTDFYLIRIDSDGEVIWSETFGSRGTEQCRSVIQTDDGGFLAAGITTYLGEGGEEIYAVKIDSAGEVEWSNTYGTEEDNPCYDVVQTSDGGYAFAGGLGTFGFEGTGDFYLVKTDGDGEVLWTETYGGRGEDLCFAIEEVEEGGLVMTGRTNSFDRRTGDDFYLVRTDAEGDVLWETFYGGSSSDNCYSITVDVSGYTLSGNTRSFGDDQRRGRNFWLLKTGLDSANAVWEVDPSLPSSADMILAYPNPFNSSTTISYSLPSPGSVSLTIFDTQGRELQHIAGGFKSAGSYSVVWNAAGLPSGVYYGKLETGEKVQTIPMVLGK
ncbi:T9SS type A sorting domain-containing protein [Calditrichota bacterium]